MAKVAFAPTALYKTPIADPKTGLTPWSWTQHFQLAAQQINAPANTVPPPASSSANGTSGQIAFDANFLYVAVGPNLWKRLPLSAF